jgi:hypothetical protein
MEKRRNMCLPNTSDTSPPSEPGFGSGTVEIPVFGYSSLYSPGHW